MNFTQFAGMNWDRRENVFVELLGWASKVCYWNLLTLVAQCDSSVGSGFKKIGDRALLRSGDVGSHPHVVDNDVPLRVAVHGRRAHVVTTLAVHRPEFLAAELRARITRDRAARLGGRFPACLRSSKHTPAGAGEDEENQSCKVPAIHFYDHMIP
jgi:hypothetical protein